MLLNSKSNKVKGNVSDLGIDLPPRRITWRRVGTHLLFWTWDFTSSYIVFRKSLQVAPDQPPPTDLFTYIMSFHLISTLVVFYLFGYLVLPRFLIFLIQIGTQKRYQWSSLWLLLGATVATFAAFNAMDYYVFSYAKVLFTPVPPYINRVLGFIEPEGPLGFVKSYLVQTFIWGYNVSYVLLPLLLRFIRLSIHWGIVNIQERDKNQQLITNQLQTLQYQINPHFLFNVFNSIFSLIQRTNVQAANMLSRLTRLMSYTLYETNKKFVPLAGELQFISDYIEIEKTRYFNPERISYEVAGDTQNYQVPPLLLITYVENAFKHGLENSYEEGWVRIKFSIDSEKNCLRTQVSNYVSSELKTGDKPKPGGVGLANARKRMDLLFEPKRYTLIIDERSNEYQVELSIPLDRHGVYEYQD